jgi:hypothetical protein
MNNKIVYSEGYKYQLENDFVITVSISGWNLKTPFIQLDPNGTLLIKKGYAWDGPSGPAIDTKDFMRGALVHDAIYQLMRDWGLDRNLRSIADRIMRDICILDGMSKIRAYYTYLGVRAFGGPSSKASGGYKIQTAP